MQTPPVGVFMEKINLLGLTTEEMKSFLQEMGEKPFRGKQLFKWVNRGVKDFDLMTDFSKDLRAKLKSAAYVGSLDVLNVQQDAKDGTRKFLFGLEDGNTIESVFMQYKYGNSLCVSSQVGCKMGCKFCATALDGFTRNLTAAEMLEQVYAAERETDKEINHIVVMGMGEPFDNYENLSIFLKLLHDPDGKNMSYRNMTVSTSGIIPAIDRFAEDFPQVNLAISLHRLTNEGRSAIMPVNDAYPVDKLMDAARRYTEKTGRRITFEYTLIRNENDSNADAELMKNKLSGMLCHVNLIPLNKVEETGFDGSTRRRAAEIAERLSKAGVPATVRRELGSGIDGACGQLRAKNKSIY